MIFDHSHVNLMSWDEFGGIIDSIVQKIKDSGVQYDAVTPILRSGGIPAMMIANKLKIIPTVPIQVKYKYNPTIVETLIEPQCPNNKQINEIKNILVVDANTGSGRSAELVVSLLKQGFPDSKLCFVTVTKVYKEDNIVHGYDDCVYGCVTNESFLDNAPDDARYGITIFPWENVDAELADINA